MFKLLKPLIRCKTNQYLRVLLLCLFSISFCIGSAMAAGQDCKLADESSSCGISMVQARRLASEAAKYFRDDHVDCAMRILKKSSDVVRSMATGQDRAIAGYEIKDVVYGALQGRTILDAQSRSAAIGFALQSIDPGGNIVPDAAAEELKNDMVFLFRLSDLFRQQANDKESVEALLLMVKVYNTIAKVNRPISGYDIAGMTEWLLKQSEFSGIYKILSVMRRDDDRDVVLSLLVQQLYGNLGIAEKNALLFRYSDARTRPSEMSSFDKSATLNMAVGAEKLMLLIQSEPDSFFQKMNTPKYLFWNFRLYKFIWQSYLVVDDRKNAERVLVAWLAAIRQLNDRGQRVDALIATAQALYVISIERPRAFSILREAEGEAGRIEDPKYRNSSLQNMTRQKSWMK